MHLTRTPSDLTDLSYVTGGLGLVVYYLLIFDTLSPSGSYSDGDRALYLQSMNSQSEALGFGTPINMRRRRDQNRGVFR